MTAFWTDGSWVWASAGIDFGFCCRQQRILYGRNLTARMVVSPIKLLSITRYWRFKASFTPITLAIGGVGPGGKRGPGVPVGKTIALFYD